MCEKTSRSPGDGSLPFLRRSRSKKFTFAPTVNGEVPRTDTISHTFVRPRRKRSTRRTAASERKKVLDGLAELSKSDASSTWHDSAIYNSTGALHVAIELLTIGANTRALLKQWERNDWWQTWIVGDKVLDADRASAVGDAASLENVSPSASTTLSSSRPAPSARSAKKRDGREAKSSQGSSRSSKGEVSPGGSNASSKDSPGHESDAKDLNSSPSRGGGMLSKAQFRKAMRAVMSTDAFSAKHVDALFDDMDEDRKGRVSIASIVSALKQLSDDMHAVATGTSVGRAEKLGTKVNKARPPLDEQREEEEREAALAKEAAERERAEAERRERRSKELAAAAEAAKAAAEEERKRKEALLAAEAAKAAELDEHSDGGGRRRRNASKYAVSSDFRDEEQVRRWFRAPPQPAVNGPNGTRRSRVLEMWQSAAAKVMAGRLDGSLMPLDC